MAAVLRVKRKAASSPEEMLIISRKRQKTESSSSAEEIITEQTILHFAGTIKDLNEDIAQYVTNVPNLEEKARSGTKRTLPCDSKTSNAPGKVSRLTKLDSVTDRFKVVNCQRSVDMLSKESSEDKWMTLIDIEDSWNISKTSEDAKEVISSGDTPDIDNIEKKEIKKEDMEEYVYDLYYVQTCNDVWFENDQIMIQHPEYLVPEQYSDEDKSTTDSNSESHWRNDYPDSETDSDDSASSPEFYSDYDTYEEGNYYDEFEADMCNIMVDLEQLQTGITRRSCEEMSESDSDESFGIL